MKAFTEITYLTCGTLMSPQDIFYDFGDSLLKDEDKPDAAAELINEVRKNASLSFSIFSLLSKDHWYGLYMIVIGLLLNF